MGAIIPANKIKNKYKKMRAKNRSLPFNLDKIEEAEIVNYTDDTNIADDNLNRNATIAAKKISENYRNICRKRKIVTVLEPIEEIKAPERSKRNRKLIMMAAKKIKDKYKNLCFR